MFSFAKLQGATSHCLLQTNAEQIQSQNANRKAHPALGCYPALCLCHPTFSPITLGLMCRLLSATTESKTLRVDPTRLNHIRSSVAQRQSHSRTATTFQEWGRGARPFRAPSVPSQPPRSGRARRRAQHHGQRPAGAAQTGGPGHAGPKGQKGRGRLPGAHAHTHTDTHTHMHTHTTAPRALTTSPAGRPAAAAAAARRPRRRRRPPQRGGGGAGRPRLHAEGSGGGSPAPGRPAEAAAAAHSRSGRAGSRGRMVLPAAAAPPAARPPLTAPPPAPSRLCTPRRPGLLAGRRGQSRSPRPTEAVSRNRSHSFGTAFFRLLLS